MRRTLTLIAIVIVILGLIIGVYFFFFANKGPSLTVDGSAVENPFGGVGSGTSTNTGVGTGSSGETDFTDTGAFADEIAGFGPAVRVVSPPELVDQVVCRLRGALARNSTQNEGA